MNPPRADKTDTPPKNAKPTTYEIAMRTSKGPETPTYQLCGRVEATSAPKAIRGWCEKRGDQLVAGRYRAVPVGNITELEVKVETKRQLTLGAPAS